MSFGKMSMCKMLGYKVKAPTLCPNTFLDGEIEGYKFIIYKSLFYHLQAPFILQEHSKVKGIKKGHKTFYLYIYGWEGMCLSVCVSVCMDYKVE